MHTMSHAATLSVSLAHGCSSSTGRRQGEMQLRNHQVCVSGCGMRQMHYFKYEMECRLKCI